MGIGTQCHVPTAQTETHTHMHSYILLTNNLTFQSCEQTFTRKRTLENGSCDMLPAINNKKKKNEKFLISFPMSKT